MIVRSIHSRLQQGKARKKSIAPASDELLTQMIRVTIHANIKLRRVAVIDLDPVGLLGRFKRCLPAKRSVATHTY